MPYSSLGRPATALSPTFGITEPLKVQTSSPFSVWTTFGAWSLYLSGMCPSNRVGGSTRWSSTLTRMRSSAFTVRPPVPVRSGPAGSYFEPSFGSLNTVSEFSAGVEGSFPHLLSHGHDRRVGERAALPVGPVDDERVARDEAGVGR